jgi:hypothetical protein
MSTRPATTGDDRTSVATADRALRRILAELHDGLRHGFFELTVTCEVIGQERRRLTLRAGKSHQFVIPKEECVRSAEGTADSCDGSDPHVD